jgi:hypothetical protein
VCFPHLIYFLVSASCPICSEDYSEHEDVVKLPCAHIYHSSCLLPWLESKRTCPICRFEVRHEVLVQAELEALGREEVKFRLSARGALEGGEEST